MANKRVLGFNRKEEYSVLQSPVILLQLINYCTEYAETYIIVMYTYILCIYGVEDEKMMMMMMVVMMPCRSQPHTHKYIYCQPKLQPNHRNM